jgi:hypothetical protein
MEVSPMSPFKLFLALIAGAIYVHAGALKAQGVSRTYELVSVDGQRLPAVWMVSQGDTTWVHSADAILAPDGNSTTHDSVTYTYHGKRYAGGAKGTVYARYRIYGDSIEIAALRNCKAPCGAGWVGTISDSAMALTILTKPPRKWAVFEYRRRE